MLDLAPLRGAPPRLAHRALAIAMAALALASVAGTAAADPATACAPASAVWDSAAENGDPAAMRSAMRSIPGVCAQLLSRARARLAAVEAGERRAAALAPSHPHEAPPAAEAGGALSDLLDRIEAELAVQGPVAWKGFAHDSDPKPGYEGDWTYEKRAEMTGFHYDLAQCDFDYNFKVEQDGKVTTDGDAGIPLKHLRAIHVSELADLLRIRDAQAGHPTYSSRLQPAIYAVEAIRLDGQYNELDFFSLETARRVARLIEAAAAKCGASPVVRY
jgi:hypothetical protein